MTRKLKTALFCAIWLWGFLVFSQQKKEVTILWDSSSSMMDRDIEKEFYFLEAYFKNSPDLTATLLTFSNAPHKKETFVIENGNWSALRERLLNTSYDGATSYQNLEEFDGAGDILLFTDGVQTGRPATPNFSGELFTINASKTFDRANINLLTLVNNGNYVNLLNQKQIGKPADQRQILYSGKIYQDTKPVKGATVFVKGKRGEAVQSNTDGYYEIESLLGEILVLSYRDKSVELALGENTTNDFWIEGNQIRLDEVVVSEDKIEPVEKVTTGYGLENRDKIGYAVQSIGDEDISDISYTANNAVQGKFSGVRLGQNDDLSQVIMRPANSILGNNYGLIVIDGIPTQRTESGAAPLADATPSAPAVRSNGNPRPQTITSTTFIDPNNIAKITVLKGLAATNRFGSMGANGVLLITTKTGTYGRNSGEKRDLARLTDNIFDGKIKVNNKALVTPYLKELKQGKTVQEAYDIYLTQKKNYSEAPEYFIDVHDFFKASNPQLAERILSNILEKKRPGYEELRALYLNCSKLQNNEWALLAAQKMLDIFPDRIQTHFDFAKANRDSGNYQLALNTLTDMLQRNTNQELDFSGLEKAAGTELRNLVNSEKSTLDLAKVNNKYLNNLTYGARLVFEWNNANSDFVLQFVNPQKRYFDWEHTVLADRNRIQNELRNGFFTEQFEIFGAESRGDWQVNVTYLGNRSQNSGSPLFLKCAVYYDFGSPEQRKEEYLVRLHEKEEKQLFFKFSTK